MRLIILHGFLVMLMSVAIDSSCYMKTNGCTVPSRLPRFYKKDFTPACKKHDVCYSCVRFTFVFLRVKTGVRTKNSITKSEQHAELRFSRKNKNKTDRDKIG